MIVHNWCGNFGRMANQMFQFTAAVGLAEKLGTDWYIFNNQEWAHSLDLNKAFKLPNTKWIDKNETMSFPDYHEAHWHYDPRLLTLSSPLKLHGYFQCEKYFTHCRDTILEEFTFKDDIYLSSVEKKKSLGDKPLCSIHVRRGDYLNLPQYHPVQGFNYYDAALESVRDRCEDFNIVYLTDDPEWVGHNMIPKYGGTVAKGSAYEDMCLMSICDHNIIANSSFSWWGAWLNKNENKVVVSPRNWFGPSGPPDSSTIHCEGWDVR